MVAARERDGSQIVRSPRGEPEGERTVSHERARRTPAGSPCGHASAYSPTISLAATRLGDHAIDIGDVERVQTASRRPLVCARVRLDNRITP
jgi:hypothetical protein